jgi:DNA-binding Lrp family transcriptional regulator
MADADTSGLDEIDREILHLLMPDPRMPYSEIAGHLEEAGYEMSSEGVRHRVKKLFDETSIFLLSEAKGNDWEVLRLNIEVSDRDGATETVYETLTDHNFWLVSRGFGTVDVHAIATVSTVHEADELVNTVRGLDAVDDVSYFLETERHTDMHKYTTGEPPESS